MSNSELLTQIYKARNTLIKQLESNGYDCALYKNCSINLLQQLYSNSELDMTVKKEHTIYVKYLVDKSIRIQMIEEIIEDLYNVENILNKNDTLIIVAKDSANDSIKQYLSTLFIERDIFIIHVSLAQLQFNVLEHELVPKHILLNSDEEKEFRKKYSISKNIDIPEISRFDAVTKAIHARPNQVVKIERPSKNSVISIYYRLCKNK